MRHVALPKLRVMLRYARIVLLSCLSAVPIGGCTQWQPIDVSSGGGVVAASALTLILLLP